MARTEDTTRSSSVWGHAATFGIAAGAIQALRNNTVRSKFADAVERVKKAIRDGADDAGDMVEPTPGTYKDSASAANGERGSVADTSEHLKSDDGQAATETLKDATEGVRHAEA